jgi:hypothetical protein
MNYQQTTINPTSNMQNTVQYELLNKFRTGNPIYDAVISSMIFTIVALIVNKLDSVFNSIKYGSTSLWYLLYNTIYIIYNKLMKNEDDKKFIKEVIIDSINDNRQINELYKAVNWYISNNESIDYIRETPLKLNFDKKIDIDNARNILNSNIILGKSATLHKEKYFTFKDHKISYTISKNLISVFTDQERKRENMNITLRTEMYEKSKNDILSDFCQHCLEEYIKNITTKNWIQMLYINKNGKWESKESNNRRKIDTIVLDGNIKDEIKNDIQLFLQSEDWYHNIDIPYTRGYLLYGPPGTGKTSMIKAIANLTRRHMHYLNLNEVKSDTELIDLLKNINYRETVLIIEDIDCMSGIVKDRSITTNTDYIKEVEELKKKMKKYEKKLNGNDCNVDDKSTLSLSTLLNCIDGVFNNEGRILVMTTNHPEVLDDALIRPGRIDKKILLNNCSIDQISKMYKLFFNNNCDFKLLRSIPDYKYSPAYISSLFMQYRHNPLEAFNNIDNLNEKPVIKTLYDDYNMKETKCTNVQNNIYDESYILNQQINHMKPINFGMTVQNQMTPTHMEPIQFEMTAQNKEESYSNISFSKMVIDN